MIGWEQVALVCRKMVRIGLTKVNKFEKKKGKNMKRLFWVTCQRKQSARSRR